MTTPENPVDPDSDAAFSEVPGAESGFASAEGAADAVPSAGGAGTESAPDADPAAGKEAELTADLQRVSAEFANYRKRTAREVIDARAAGKAAVVGELLAVVDDLARARSHGDLESGPLKAVSDKFDAVLGRLGLTAFGAVGDPFDPAIHEAVQHEGDGSDPVLGAVLRQGYQVDGKVIRTAMVAVTDRSDTGADHVTTESDSDSVNTENRA